MTKPIALNAQHCTPCRTGEGRLDEQTITNHLGALPQWQLSAGGIAIHTRRSFKNFVQALAWVNSVAEVAEAENHHPDIMLGWGYAELTLTTHDAGGLTLNDFILAAKIDTLAS